MDAFFELATPVPSEEILSASGTDQVPTNAERTGAARIVITDYAHVASMTSSHFSFAHRTILFSASFLGYL
ncbi:hypothetical protein A0H81_08654 [Grifola frondosa]|uniref:Uncharacterized protein n=1 Tax=Grifola frondosa TaxID=5627 RepID=A0A1C7M2S7_GRIFR|nr:hypothetical protein A0H81_08654 [Grifola frondosa]